MLSNAVLMALRDIAYHVDLATHFTVGFDYEAFKADLDRLTALARHG